MMHGMKKSDEAIVPLMAANKGAGAARESPEGRASTKGNPRDQTTLRRRAGMACHKRSSGYGKLQRESRRRN